MRVVTTTCSNTEIVCALGCAATLVGCDRHSDHPEAVVARLPRVGADLAIDVARVRALRPDLVLASLTVPGHERVVEALEAAGLPVVTLAPVSLADVVEDVRHCGQLLGVPERGAVLADALRAALLDTLPGTVLPGRPPGSPPPSSSNDRAGAPAPGCEKVVAHAVASSRRPAILVEWWPKPVIVPGRDSWVSELIERAGGRNPFAARAVKSLPVTTDEVRVAAPDAVVIAWCGVPTVRYRPSVVLQRPGWQDVPAVRHIRVHPVPEAYLGRPGPRLVQGLAALREVVAACHDPQGPAS